MAKLIVAIEIKGYTAEDVRAEIEESRGTFSGWWDGDKFLVDSALLTLNKDGQYYECEYRGVED